MRPILCYHVAIPSGAQALADAGMYEMHHGQYSSVTFNDYLSVMFLYILL